MKKHLLASVALLALLGLQTGCGSGGSSAQADAPATQPSRPIPPDSIFAKVKIGMSQQEVYGTIGQPTSSGGYITGKSFIPFHNFSGNDDTRIAAHYKGVGLIIFSKDNAYTSGYSVMEVDYDPSDTGY